MRKKPPLTKTFRGYVVIEVPPVLDDSRGLGTPAPRYEVWKHGSNPVGEFSALNAALDFIEHVSVLPADTSRADAERHVLQVLEPGAPYRRMRTPTRGRRRSGDPD